jgi:hypothetical protein
MRVQSSPVLTPQPSPLLVAIAPQSGFDERWTAWQARGAAHDRALRRRIAIAAPIVAIVGAVLFLFLAL